MLAHLLNRMTALGCVSCNTRTHHTKCHSLSSLFSFLSGLSPAHLSLAIAYLFFAIKWESVWCQHAPILGAFTQQIALTQHSTRPFACIATTAVTAVNGTTVWRKSAKKQLEGREDYFESVREERWQMSTESVNERVCCLFVLLYLWWSFIKSEASVSEEEVGDTFVAVDDDFCRAACFAIFWNLRNVLGDTKSSEISQVCSARSLLHLGVFVKKGTERRFNKQWMTGRRSSLTR